MSKSKFLPIVAIAGLLAFSGDLCAQSSLSSSASESANPLLRIQLVITRYSGEKKTGSIPYTFTVTTGGNGGSRISMGVDVPITQATGAAGITNVEYKSIGTSIDCNNAVELPGGRYTFVLNVAHTSTVPDSAGDARPMLRQFNTSFSPVLRDGQSLQAVASADPVTGEVVKIDVTMNVVR